MPGGDVQSADIISQLLKRQNYVDVVDGGNDEQITNRKGTVSRFANNRRPA